MAVVSMFLALLGNLALAAPVDCPLNNLTSPYTLTAYAPWNDYNGLKVNNLNLFQAKVYQYCPFTGNQSHYCPNGTDMAFAGTLTPLVTVPGGQDLYVAENGKLDITVQHSHSFPPGSFPSYYGWKWNALPVDAPLLGNCRPSVDEYDCRPPTGWFTFKAPGTTGGGVLACREVLGGSSATTLWARTPKFNQSNCVEFLGFGTHPYAGINPPVWAYY